MSPLDLHVLGTPPAFVLSQDQTLPFNPSRPLRLPSRSVPFVPSRLVPLRLRAFTLWNLRCLLASVPFRLPASGSLAILPFNCAFLLCIVFKVRLALSRSPASELDYDIKSKMVCQALFFIFLKNFSDAVRRAETAVICSRAADKRAVDPHRQSDRA